MSKPKQTNKHLNPKLPRLGAIMFWLVFFTTHFITCFWITWIALSKWDFGYAIAYDLIGSEFHIAQFAPKNIHKAGFEAVTRDQHIELFGQINWSVHHQGLGLSDISYTLANGNNESLLHQAEVIHLQDVANLIDQFYATSFVSLAIFLLFLAMAIKAKIAFPSTIKIITGFLSVLVSSCFAILIIGPTKVFYWAHTVVFPPENQWFFYYEESLMTTLMKAPDLFAFIAILLLAGFIICWALSFTTIKKLLH